MATGRSMQLTKQVGEYLVCAELCRNNLISTTFTGNVPMFDILAINDNSQTSPIQVKTIKDGSWQFDAKKFLEIEIIDNVQYIRGKKKLDFPDLKFVFVRLKAINRVYDEFYICKQKDIQHFIYKNYKKWLDSHGGRRPKKPLSTHCSITLDNLKGFKDNWNLILKMV